MDIYRTQPQRALKDTKFTSPKDFLEILVELNTRTPLIARLINDLRSPKSDTVSTLVTTDINAETTQVETTTFDLITQNNDVSISTLQDLLKK